MGEHALFSSGMLGAFLWLMGAVATDMVAIYALVRCQGFRQSFWTCLSIAMIFLSGYKRNKLPQTWYRELTGDMEARR